MSIEQNIQGKLIAQFEPTFLKIENESHLHSSGRGAESHFKVTLVSAQFEGKRSVERHQLIYSCLKDELEQGVHALALHTYTSQEWQAANGVIPQSTNCLGVGK